jgi:hypothetical protein
MSTPFPDDLSRQSLLNVYATLSGIGASICECRCLNLLSYPMMSKFESDLLTWYTSVSRCFRVSAADQSMQSEAPFTLMPLWHYTWMTLTTDLHTLELAIGKDGNDIPPSTREYVLSWISSPDSQRCLLHALFLQNTMSSMNMVSFIPMHTARILFSAAVCWAAYMLYLPLRSRSDEPAGASTRPDDLMIGQFQSYPEVQLLRQGYHPSSKSARPNSDAYTDTISALRRTLAANPAEMKATTLCVLECILRRLDTGGMAKKFADLIQVLISGELEKEQTEEPSLRSGFG